MHFPAVPSGTVSATGTVCASMIAAVGQRSLPARTRSWSRRVSRMRCQTPARIQRTKIAYTYRSAGTPTAAAAARSHRDQVQGGVQYNSPAMVLGYADATAGVVRRRQQRLQERPPRAGNRRGAHAPRCPPDGHGEMDNDGMEVGSSIRLRLSTSPRSPIPSLTTADACRRRVLNHALRT